MSDDFFFSFAFSIRVGGNRVYLLQDLNVRRYDSTLPRRKRTLFFPKRCVRKPTQLQGRCLGRNIGNPRYFIDIHFGKSALKKQTLGTV